MTTYEKEVGPQNQKKKSMTSPVSKSVTFTQILEQDRNMTTYEVEVGPQDHDSNQQKKGKL